MFPKELKDIKASAQQIQRYDQATYIIESRSMRLGMIEMRMYEMKLWQRSLAQKLNMSDAKLSLIMNGKQKTKCKPSKSCPSTIEDRREFYFNSFIKKGYRHDRLYPGI